LAHLRRVTGFKETTCRTELVIIDEADPLKTTAGTTPGTSSTEATSA
jgi:hypothetical protein